MIKAPFAVAAIAAMFWTSGAGADVAETPHVEFVREYVRELAEMENIRAGAMADLKRKEANPLLDGIHWSTSSQLALRTSIGILSGMRISGQFGSPVPQIIAFYKQKLDIHGRLIAISTEFMSGPKPGADYGKMVAEMPKLRAMLDSVDESLMQLSTLVFVTVIDEKPDKAGHLSRLTITRDERRDLLRQLQTSFGVKLDQNNEDYFVDAAEVLRSLLRKDKGYKCSDET
jgi:hypothetical protein